MTELEKAASGLLYDANSDPALLEARAQTSDLCMDYNALRSSPPGEKRLPSAIMSGLAWACRFARASPSVIMPSSAQAAS